MYMLKKVKKLIDNFWKKEKNLINYQNPEDLDRKFNLEKSDIIKELEKVIKYSVKTHNPYFFNQLYAGADTPGVLGEFVSALLNTSMYTYEVAPVFNILEKQLFEKYQELFGFQDCIFAPGGSFSNIYALHLARFKQSGSKIYMSDQSHYSFEKGASLAGLQNVVKIPSDNLGKIRLDLLEEEIKKEKPMMIVGTAGTTVFGAFDNIQELANLAEKYNIWLHVDASWGGSAIFSRKKYLLNGISRADSMTVNPHKLMRCPLQCSLFLTNHPGLLKECNSQDAKYLFQKDKFYDTKYDTGDKYLQCGRRNDILKLWLQWKHYGIEGFTDHVNACLDKTQYLYDKIKYHPNYKLVVEPEFINLCFWYLPHRLVLKEYMQDELNQIAPKIKEKMMRDGTMMIGYQPLGEFPNFFRMIIINDNVNEKVLDNVVKMIHNYGKYL